jgi:hypothetical protein
MRVLNKADKALKKRDKYETSKNAATYIFNSY